MEKNRLGLSFKGLLFDQFVEYKYYYLFGIFTLIITHLIQSELPFMAKKIADLIFSETESLKAWPFVLSALGIIIFRTGSRILFFYPARLLQRQLRVELVEKFESRSPFRYKQYNSGQIFQHLSSDIEQIRALIGFVGLQSVNFLIAFIILVPKILDFNKELFVALLPLLITFILFSIIVTNNRKYFKLTQEKQGEVQNLIIESYIGKKTIRNYHAEKSFIDLFKEMSLTELYYFYKSSLGVSFTLPLINLGIGISLLWGAYIIKTQDLGASSLILFSGFIFLFMEPLSSLTWIGMVISRSSASWKRLNEMNVSLDSESEIEKKIQEIQNNKDEVIVVPYWNNSIELNILKSRWNVLIAKTGHGKSELILKIAETLKLKGISVNYVAQDPYIYNDTIKNNIFLGLEVTEADIANAKQLLLIFGLDFINDNLDSLLDLEVGENGKRLSGGQAKRLCLIRSLMGNQDYILWDDPFSSVDLILEKEIITKLRELEFLKTKTLVLTSHRLSTVKMSDNVIYTDKELGIVESGDVKKLLSAQSKTYEYFQQQMV